MLARIVGIEIEVTKLVGKWKPSQNREAREETLAGEMLKAD